MTTPPRDEPKLQRNRLLDCLPEADRDRIRPHLQRVPLQLGQVVYESGVTLQHVYFPIDCIVSLFYVLADGDSSELAMVGNEGVVGIPLFMGGEATTSRAVVQSAGHALRLDGAVLKQEFSRAGALQGLLLRYTQALLTQMIQTAACNKYHSAPQQLCRWLLHGLDRLPDNNVTMTQGLMSNVLAPHRQGVSAAAGVLQAAGLIHFDRGTFTLDRSRLEQEACECYGVVKREFDRLLPDVTAG